MARRDPQSAACLFNALTRGFVCADLGDTLLKNVSWLWRSRAFLWCNFVNGVRCGKTADEIVAYAKEQEVDLICIGASGDDWSVGKLFGSNVDRVLWQAPCPVLVARPINKD